MTSYFDILEMTGNGKNLVPVMHETGEAFNECGRRVVGALGKFAMNVVNRHGTHQLSEQSTVEPINAIEVLPVDIPQAVL